MENPYKNGMIWRENPLFSETPIYQQLINIYILPLHPSPWGHANFSRQHPRWWEQRVTWCHADWMSFWGRRHPKKRHQDIGGWGIVLFLGPKRVFFDENSNWALFWIILISTFTVRLTNSGPGMVLRLPRCALIFKPFSGDWKMVGIRKPNDFFQFFQCHPSREETHRSSEVQFGSRLYCFKCFSWHQMVHYSEPGINN